MDDPPDVSGGSGAEAASLTRPEAIPAEATMDTSSLSPNNSDGQPPAEHPTPLRQAEEPQDLNANRASDDAADAPMAAEGSDEADTFDVIDASDDASPRASQAPLGIMFSGSSPLRARPAQPPPQPERPSAERAPRSPPAAPAGPAHCERCAKAGFTPQLRCFARIGERCRVLEGRNEATPRWHHVSALEHYCHDCVEHYGRGEARKVWQAEQARGKCSFKDLVVRRHLPSWARCTRAECGAWRAVPTASLGTLDLTTWHCGLSEHERSGGVARRERRRAQGSCDLPVDPVTLSDEPPEEPGIAVSFVVLGASDAEVKEAATEARLPWWDLSRFESAGVQQFGLASLLSHPCRYVAVRNLVLWKWRRCRATGHISARDALESLGGVGLQRVWYAAAVPHVTWLLERLGLINFGATRRLVMRAPRPPPAHTPWPERRTFVIIGAGIAGLCTAQQLRRFGHRAIVLEAQSRVGGRVLTEDVAGTPIDLGAMLLVGTVGNPLVALCEQTGCATHELNRSACPLYDGDRVLEGAADARAEQKFNALMTTASEQRNVRKGKRALLGVSNGGRWERELLHLAQPPADADAPGGSGGARRKRSRRAGEGEGEAATATAAGTADGKGGAGCSHATTPVKPAEAAEAAGASAAVGEETSCVKEEPVVKEEEEQQEDEEEEVFDMHDEEHAMATEQQEFGGEEDKAGADGQVAAADDGHASDNGRAPHDGDGDVGSVGGEAHPPEGMEGAGEEGDWLMAGAVRARNTWLACDLCGQWRRLGKMKESLVPESWECSLNPDPEYARCEVPQELPDEEIDRLLGLLPPKYTREEKEAERLAKAEAKAAAKAAKEAQREAAKAEREAARAKKAAEKEAKAAAKKERPADCEPMPGEPPPICGKSLGEVLDQLVAKAKVPPEEARAIHWHLANLEYGCATALHNVSLSWWDQDDGHDFGGSHVLVTNGFDRMVKGLSDYLEVLTEREVSTVEYSATGAKVHVRGGGEGIECDAVVVTVPLGVLKAKGSLAFSPPLPEWKKQAIERLGFGPIEKVVLLFERRFWEEGIDFFGCLAPPDLSAEELSARRGEFFLFWNLERSHNTPALVCISSGQFADRTWRQHSYKGVVNKALAVLRRSFGAQVTALFKRSVVSDWGRNPYARGSYSYVAVGGSGRDYDELAWPVGVGNTQRVFFAGEHTNGQHPATATGAFISGLREAQRIDALARDNFVCRPDAGHGTGAVGSDVVAS